MAMRYVVLGGVKTLGEVGGHIGRGEIIDTGRGTAILRCPACHRLQFVVNKIVGDARAPNLLEPMQCGSGYCAKCGVWFRIVNGVSEEMEDPDPTTPEIPSSLRRAGVRKPPRIED